MHDPLLNCLALGGPDKRVINIDPERVQVEEFEAAAVLTEIIWGPEGFAEMLGPTWAMVHDPRFLQIEREGIIYKRSMSGRDVAQGPSLIQALDLRSKIEVIDDLVIYAELIGEGRHFLNVARQQSIDPHGIQSDPDTIMRLMESECSNYKRRNGTWNDEALRLIRMLKAGLVGLVADYAEVAYSRDWIRMDTQEVVPEGSRALGGDGDMDSPTVAVEVDTLQRALTMRAQVRLTALRVLRQFPGIKASDLEAITLTDEEADKLCQILFKAPSLDKLYTVLPEVMNLVKYAQAVPYATRAEREIAEGSAKAKEFCAKLISGEVEPIVTNLEDNGLSESPMISFISNLLTNDVERARFEAIQMYEADGDPEAVAIVKDLIDSKGSQENWDRVVRFLESQLATMKATMAQSVQASLDAPNAPAEPVTRNVTTVEETL